jgi:hypothetical protein
MPTQQRVEADVCEVLNHWVSHALAQQAANEALVAYIH